MNDGRTADRGSGGGAPDLDALRRRLDALHESVEQLGCEGGPPAGPASAPPPGQPPPPYAPPQGSAPAAYGYDPEPAAPPAYQAPVEPADFEQPSYPVAPPPAATNGGSEGSEGGIPAPANVTILDVGPFADLVELRHFEEAVARLDTVREVRVRRYGHNRAKVEVGMVGPHLVGRELFRLGRPIVIEPGPDGEVIIDFTDIEIGEPDPTAAGAEEPAGGAGTPEAEASPEDER
jgi:hypothetical protein